MPATKLSRADKRVIFEESLVNYANETIEELAKRFKVTPRHIRRLCKDGLAADGWNAFRQCMNCDVRNPAKGEIYCSSQCEIAFKSQCTGVNGIFPQEEIDAIKPYGDIESIKDDTESDE